jgi:tetratricopeptide (TPR) repeat protein/CHAT domain-containing protein
MEKPQERRFPSVLLPVFAGMILVSAGLRAAPPAARAKGAAGGIADRASELAPDERERLERLGLELNLEASREQHAGRYDRAVELLEQVVRILERLYPPERYPQGHPDLGASLNNLGFMLKVKGEYGRALGDFRRALEILENCYPPERYPQGHSALAVTMDNLGSLLGHLGDYRQALDYLRKALEMKQRLYPPPRYPQGHPDLAVSLNNLGSLFQAQHDQRQALGYFRDALEMNQRLYPRERFPEGHPELATNLVNLAVTHKELGDLEQALDYDRRAVEMYRRLYPKQRYPRGHLRLAATLNHMGTVLQALHDDHEAERCFRQALAMSELLYPNERYPQGHLDLAIGLSNVASVLQARGDYDQALDRYRQAMQMLERLYPKQRYPQGHPDLVRGLSHLADLYKDMGNYGQALRHVRQSLEMKERLYSRAQYPRGHPELVTSLNALGLFLENQGDHGQALIYYRQALEMGIRLYSPQQYPQGHPDLALILNNLGAVFQRQGKYDLALKYHRRALEIYERLYPPERYPQGHPDLSMSLNNLGAVLRAQGDYGQAMDYLRRTLEMNRKLYPTERYPQGHRLLFASLTNLASVLEAQGDYGQAMDDFRQALALGQRLYPQEQYPHGHSDLAASLSNLGFCLHSQGRSADALAYLVKGVAMSQAITADFLGSASEAEALNFGATLLYQRNRLISAAAAAQRPENDLYSEIWTSKAAVAGMVLRRHRAVIESFDPQVRADGRELVALRRRLAELLLTPASPEKSSAETVRSLNARKEELERSLADRLPEFRRAEALSRRPSTELERCLRRGEVFIDSFWYLDYQQDPGTPGEAGERRIPSYVVFVLRPGQRTASVFLGSAAPIDAAIEAWRAEIKDDRPGPAAETLRCLVWDKLAPLLPPGTQTVYVSPDAALTRLPWSALPGRTPGTLLLEDHALAVVPSGPFLLDRLTLTPDRASEKGGGCLLAVGDVRYDDRPAPIPTRPVALASLRAPVGTDQTIAWPPLPGTLRELEAVEALAGERPVLTLTGRDAGTGRVLAELPRARWALLATHGFFADPRFRSALQLDESSFRRGLGGIGKDRALPGARNPLVLSGLVLAGANLPVPSGEDGLPQGDGGILTAEAVAGLPLQNLELVVLSACETGLGEVAGGEGVFGLQRAFHIAGAHDVIASLWRVDDEATAALMRLFFRKLWIEGKPPLAALREAQLFIYRNPDRMGEVARARGLDFGNEVTVAQGPVITSPHGKRAATRLWAGFVLSGTGRGP